MDSALGPPEAMAETDLTPMMRQYYELCDRYDDAIVLFQVGDFYETFCGAAERTARLLELTLTSREDSTGEYPMTGIPVDTAGTYVERLLEAGYRVAIAEQVEDVEETSDVVERAVTRVVTPGTLTDDELLESDDNNFVAAVARGDGETTRDDEMARGSGEMTRDDEMVREDDEAPLALALLDVSTGEFLATSSTRRATIVDEVRRFGPAEAIVGPDAPNDCFPEDCMVTPFERRAFDRETARARLGTYLADPDSLLAGDAEVRACGAVLAYAEYARGGIGAVDGGGRRFDGGEGSDDEAHISDDGPDAGECQQVDGDAAGATDRLEYITTLTRYDPREYLLLDAVALRSLELFEPRAVRGREDATVVGVLDETASALGGRKLRHWLRRPLLDADRIDARLDAVEELTASVRVRERVRDRLRDVYDLERLIGRVSRERANARDLRSLHDTLAAVPDLRDALADAESDRLQRLRESLDPLADVRDLIDRAIVADPPLEITEGGIVAEGYDEDLDALRETARDGKRWIDDLEERERERTGIDSLKVGHTSVHGYYVEVTNPNLEDVPEDYRRRQTLKRSERFVTPELEAREDEIVRAEGRADEREYDLFREVRREVATEVERVQALAEAVSTLDALASLATVAAEHDYVRPEIVEETAAGPTIRVEGGRHPVVERTREAFVPNDVALDEERRLAVITGPNMSGKSTYVRQVALIVLLAQVGGFVPAERARVTPVDRIFTRVGASDDIAGGRSTFMVEMDELATILAEADERSLVLLDEVGRGTSTADGLAIARAITEYLHDEVGATTLFATHHHPLTEVAVDLERAFASHFEATEADGEVGFDHEIAPGAAEGSYGVEVATAAGVPDAVVERARELVASNGRDAPSSAREGSPNGSIGSSTPHDRPSIDEEVFDDVSDAVPSTDRAESPADADPTATGEPGSTASADGGDDLTDVAAELRAIDLARLTPVEALTELDRLKRLLEE